MKRHDRSFHFRYRTSKNGSVREKLSCFFVRGTSLARRSSLFLTFYAFSVFISKISEILVNPGQKSTYLGAQVELVEQMVIAT